MTNPRWLFVTGIQDWENICFGEMIGSVGSEPLGDDPGGDCSFHANSYLMGFTLILHHSVWTTIKESPTLQSQAPSLYRAGPLVGNRCPPWFVQVPGGSAERICLPAQEVRVESLGWEDPLDNGMAAHSSVLARQQRPYAYLLSELWMPSSQNSRIVSRIGLMELLQQGQTCSLRLPGLHRKGD